VRGVREGGAKVNSRMSRLRFKAEGGVSQGVRGGRLTWVLGDHSELAQVCGFEMLRQEQSSANA
jgi:hypothetical protein